MKGRKFALWCAVLLLAVCLTGCSACSDDTHHNTETHVQENTNDAYDGGGAGGTNDDNMHDRPQTDTENHSNGSGVDRLPQESVPQEDDRIPTDSGSGIGDAIDDIGDAAGDVVDDIKDGIENGVDDITGRRR